MIKVTLEFHDARKVRLEKSYDHVLVYNEEIWQTMSYSRKHDAFNCYDSLDEPEHALNAEYWCELPEMPGREEEN